MRRLSFVVALCLLLWGASVRGQEQRTLRILWMGSDADQHIFDLVQNEFIADFEAENPNVAVEFQTANWDEGRGLIFEAAQNGTLPDLAMVGARWVPEFVSEGLVEPLDPYFERAFLARFVPALMKEGASYDGRIFGLPLQTSTRALFYNTELFEQAGITQAPRTWEDLRAAAQAVSALGEDIYGFGLQGGGGIETNTYFYYFVWGNGGDLYTGGNTLSALNEAPAVEALTFLQSLIDDGLTQPDPASEQWRDRVDVEALFKKGQLGMVISGTWFVNVLGNDVPDLPFEVTPLPYNTTPATYGVTDTLIMFQSSPEKELAWSFLQFLYDEGRRETFVNTVGILPELSSLATGNRVLLENPQFAMFMDELPTARFEPLHIHSETISQIVIAAVRSVYEGEAEPQAALDEAADAINEFLQAPTRRWD